MDELDLERAVEQRHAEAEHRHAERMRMEYRRDKPSRALVATNENGRGVLLKWVGFDLEQQVNDGEFTTLSELGLDDAPKGLSIWEGRFVSWISLHGEHCVDADGAFRPLNDDEWEALRRGHDLWDEADWRGP